MLAGFILVVFFSGEDMERGSYYVKQAADKVDNRFYVYIHRRISDNKIFYVGKGCGERAWMKSNRSEWWKSVEKKHGRRVEIIFDNLLEKDAFQIEIDTILEFQYFGHPLTNLTRGGDGPAGLVFTDEHRAKISYAQKTSPKVKEARNKTADRKRGVKLPPEVGRKISARLSGVPKSKEHTEAARAAKRCKTIYSFCHKDGREFTGTRYEFEVYSKLHRRQVSSLFGNRPNKFIFGWYLKEVDNSTLQS